ncbi:MAG: protein kinase [Candidatus Zixiibacteriota bacterium]|nr:MAG: protein kinase [candidate division Zixibacteria bacterium]
MPAGESNDERTRSFVALTVDTTISHYKILSKIGSGGMGDVYLADDTELARKVALKFIPASLCQDPDCRARFKREARAAAGLDHSNIVTVHEVGEFYERPYFVMQYIEGKSLRELIEQEEMSIDRIVDLAIQIGDGLREAHETGIIHRDIKPSNILIDNKGRPKLVDFGLAAVKGSERVTKAGATLGTARYMSPEQAEGQEIDERSDLFSLGIVLYEMITRRLPFTGEYEQAIIYSILKDTPEPLARYKSGVPDELQHAVDKALQKDPATRYQSVAEFLADLRLVKRGLDSTHAESFAIRIPGRPLRRRYALTGAVSVGTLAVLLWLSPPTRHMVSGLFGLSRVPAVQHLTVLPFSNLGDTPEGQVLCDGLLEIITSKLTEIEKFQASLWVVPASEVRQRDVTSAGQAHRIFGATLAVTGSLQHLDGDIRMTLNLVDTKTHRQLRSVIIDDSLANVASLQDSTVLMLAEILEVQLQPEEQKSLMARGTTEGEAYLHYLKARGYLSRYERLDNIDAAIKEFRKALDKDPDYALAYAGLGEAFWRKYETHADPHFEELAIYNSQRAVQLDDKLAPVQATLGVIYHGRGRYQQAVEQFQRALALDSASRSSLRGLAGAYTALNMNAEAESIYHKITQLWPDNWTGYIDLGLFYQRRGRADDALEQAGYAARLDPEGYDAWNNLGVLYCNLGHYEEARTAWERSLKFKPTFGTYSNLGLIYQMEKRFPEAVGMYRQALAMNDRDYRPWINLASALCQIPGSHDEMMAAYRQAVKRAEQQLTINPSDTDVLSHLADCYAVLGERNRALSLMQQALTLAPDDVEIMSTAGIVYEQLGERDTALIWIAKAFSCGYQPEHIESLPEMQSLTGDPRYKQLLETHHGESGK